MKRFTTILMLLMTVCMGAWATETPIALGASSHIKANGTFYDSNNEVVSGAAWCAKVVVGSVTLTGSVSSYSGYIDAKRNATLTISVPAGMTISSYTMGLRLTSSSIEATAGGVTLSNSQIKTVAASSVNAQSTSISFSSLKGDKSSECLIEITDFIITIDNYSGSGNTVVNSTFTREINAANGTFYKGTPALTPSSKLQYANRWVSSASGPQIKMVTSQIITNGESHELGGDIVLDDQGFRFGGTNTYTLSTTQDRYRITGYYISCYTTTGKSFTITPNGQTARSISTDESNPTCIYLDGLNTTSTTISASAGSKPYIYIKEFRVAYTDLLTTTTAALDELAKISVYSSAATTAKTTVASLYTLSEIEAAVNSAVNINVAFGNCNTTNPVKYLATTGADITGSDFSTDAAWKLTGYNAEDGTFKLYNSAHETYLGSLPSAIQTAATATTNAASAGCYYIVATTAGAAGGAGKAIFKRLDFEDYKEALHYQTSGSKAVRWEDDAKASHWDVVNVYGLTYNHYKVADAQDPSTTGATRFATSTNYYISGTNITYDAPIAGLSPVTSLNSQPSDGAISSDVVVNYYYEQDATLPFTTSTITNGELDNPTWYYMQINGLATYADGDKMKVDGSSTGLKYERWCFVGDAINGVQIFAESKGVVYPLNIASMARNDNVQLTSTSTNTRWFVSGSTLSSLTFYQKSGDNTWALHQLGDVSDGAGWSWKIGLWTTGHTVELSPAASNMPGDWAIEVVNTIPTGDEWDNAGTIGWPSLTARTTLQNALTAFGKSTTYANYSALLTARENYLSAKGSDLTTPPAGFYKFYHKTTSTGNKKYVYADGTTAKSSITNGTDAQKIWYFNGNSASLVAYSNGYQFNNMATLSTTGKNMTISGHTTHTTFPMPYNIKPSDASAWFISNDDTDYDLNRSTITEGCNFYIEKVTSLPITFKGEYASFYSPVDLTIPEGEGIKVYTGALNGAKTSLVLTEITSGILPANTGVILHLDGWTTETTKNFTILGTADTGGTGDLRGTVAAASVDANSKMVLGKSGDDWGIYKFSGTVLGGFKAYLPSTVLAPGARIITMVWDDEVTGIRTIDNGKQSVKNGAIYDLSGRKVANPSRGMYIINGRVVVIK